MRIVGGEWRGLALAGLGLGDPKNHLRPTSDRVRESLYNILEHGRHQGAVHTARVLDLFAGTGALGLEALSRGAEMACFVDHGRMSQAMIAENIARTRAGPRTQVLRTDATRLPVNSGEPYSLIFLDPPYGRGLGPRALASAASGNWIASGALIVWEEAGPQDAPKGFSLLDQRRFGQTHVTFLQAVSP